MTSFALVDDLLVASDGRVFAPDRELELRPIGRGRYASVNYKGKTYYVHRLVAQAHVDNPEGHRYVLHYDDNGWNNDASNLRWGSQKQNHRDAERNGRIPLGSDHHMAELTEASVYKARLMKAEGWHINEIASYLGVSKWTAYDALSGRTWKHVPMPDGFDSTKRTY